MPLYQVSASPDAPGRVDEPLKNEIEKFTNNWAVTSSVWLISTGETIDELRVRLAGVACGRRLVIKQVATASDRTPAPDLWAWLSRHA